MGVEQDSSEDEALTINDRLIWYSERYSTSLEGDAHLRIFVPKPSDVENFFK